MDDPDFSGVGYDPNLFLSVKDEEPELLTAAATSQTPNVIHYIDAEPKDEDPTDDPFRPLTAAERLRRVWEVQKQHPKSRHHQPPPGGSAAEARSGTLL